MQIKVITLNIWNGYELDAICDFLNEEDPDVLFLQEVYNGLESNLSQDLRSYQELQQRLSLRYSDYEPALLDIRDEGDIPWGNATFSRFPIINREAIFFNEPFNDHWVSDEPVKVNPFMPHVMLCSTIDTPAGKLNAYNLHGAWDLDGDNYSPKRKQMSEAIIAQVIGKPNVIVAGDTNANSTNQAIRNIEQYLNSVFGQELKTTFNMKRKDKPGYATAAVDMAFVSSDIRVITKSCPNVDISDHLPLIMTFEIGGKAP